MRKFINFLFGAMIGALVGATLALLLTPSSGENLRSQLGDRVSQIQTEIKQAAAARRVELEEQLAKLRSPMNP